MKNVIVLFLVIVFINFVKDKSKGQALENSEQQFLKHVKVLANDSLKGRLAGSDGEAKTINYIKTEFKNLGLLPLPNTNNFLQKFKLISYRPDSVFIDKFGERYYLGSDFYLANYAPTNGSVKLKCAFAGFGIDDSAYSDYLSVDVINKAVVILGGEPTVNNGNYLLTQSYVPSRWTKNENLKFEVAAENGANAIFFVPTTNDSLFAEFLVKNRSALKRTQYYLPKKSNSDPIPVFYIPMRLAETIMRTPRNQLLKITEPFKHPSALKNRNRKGIAVPLTWVNIFVKYNEQVLECTNVGGYIKGTKPNASILTLTAHHDHIGVNASGDIYNGADDNASGVAAVLTAARIMAEKAKVERPKHNIAFVTFSAEELGLYGSEYYTSNLPFDVSKHMAMLNLDMVGRCDNDNDTACYRSIYAIGANRISLAFDSALSIGANKLNIKLDYTYNSTTDPYKLYYRSDHYNFAKLGIPSAFLFDGFHADYHQTTDDANKINARKGALIAQLSVNLLFTLAITPKPIYIPKSKELKSEGF